MSLFVWKASQSLSHLTKLKATQQHGNYTKLNSSKLALLIEDRPQSLLAPLLTHFMAVVPPDWHFRFMGSGESVTSINRSASIRHHVRSGKLQLQHIPENMNTSGTEMISRFLTSRWLYETALWPAEWLLVFQTDSMICANSKTNIDDYLEYDWVGAPWRPNASWGGNGGLSLRRVAPIVDILRNQERINDTDPEDVWLSERLAHRHGARVANSSICLAFSGEEHPGKPEQVGEVPRSSGNDAMQRSGRNDHMPGIQGWREGYYEPMGYHIGGSGIWLRSTLWGTPEKRNHIWKYCPEVKMTLGMDLSRYVPGTCMERWP